MEQERATSLRLSELIQRRRPLTAASSLLSGCPVSTSEQRNPNSCQIHKPSFLTPQSPKLETLKLLSLPKPLIGILSLPSFPDNNLNIICSCFQFSDDSAAVCCHILYFDPKMVGQKIRLLAWNFIPFKCGKNGFLEIVRWDFLQAFDGSFCSFSRVSSFCWNSGACDIKDSAKPLIFGVIESVSPVFVVPSASKESGSRNFSGFLVNILVCECKLCKSKFLILELKNLTKENVKDHSFNKTVIVYFYGLTSSWHPGISRLTGDVVLLSGLKKKSVFIGKEESKSMHVTTDSMSLHIVKLFKNRSSICSSDIRGKGECGSYTGVITGVYMQGMVVELDEDVMLLLTDQYLTVPHCVRVGAIVTLRNVHLVNPKFSWGKMLILGACCKTSIYVESFSPLESRCHLKSFSRNLLQKFISSFSFPARLWVLLVISCFRRKFAGILSEKEILGSRHKEGLVQKYANSYLPLSAFRFRHGVLLEFCKHELCSGDNEVEYGGLRLVTPIANLIGYSEASWKKILDDRENCAGIDMKKTMFCGGRFYPQSIRRVLRTEEIGVVVLGTLKISLSSGRLQLVDATGSVDVMLDLPVSWDFDRIFEAKDFIIVMEGIPQKLVDLNLNTDRPLSCRSIFTNAPLVERQKTSLYLYHDPSEEDGRSRSLFFDWKGHTKALESGKYHLLLLTHKFPARQKYQGGRFNMFAEAIILPWDLLLAKNTEKAVLTENHRTDSMEILTNHKRLKIDHLSSEPSDYDSTDSQNGLTGHYVRSCSSSSNSCREKTSVSDDTLEIPCSIAIKGLKSCSRGILQCSNENGMNVSCCNSSRSKVLLEFGPKSFCIYQVLKIGCCYLFEHQAEDKSCSVKEHCQFRATKVFINSRIHIRSVDISCIESLQTSDTSDHFLDIKVFVPSTVLNSLLSLINISGRSPSEPKDSFNQEPDAHERGGPITASTQSSAISCSDNPLPVGGLISLHGLIVALHDCDSNAVPIQSMLVPGKGCLPMFLQGNGGVCVHLLVEHRMVTIFYDLSKQAYPVGFGKDIHATFHRILVLRGPNKYMVTHVSFITINDISLIREQRCDEFNSTERTALIQRVTSPNTVPAALISDVLQLSHLKPMQFRCRVVAVYVLVMEETKETKVFQSSASSCLSISIPLAGFVMGDGSSSCCCWTEFETAVTLLGLDSEDNVHKTSENCRNAKTGKRLPHISTVGRLNRILEQHGRVIVKNYGSLVDSLSQEVAFSIGSGKSISRSEEDLLTSLIVNPSLSKFWNVSGSLMDPAGVGQLRERLTEVDMAMPSLQNIWATSVCQTDILAEARNILHQLL